MRKELIAPCGMNCCICNGLFERDPVSERECARACARACCRGSLIQPTNQLTTTCYVEKGRLYQVSIHDSAKAYRL